MDTNEKNVFVSNLVFSDCQLIEGTNCNDGPSECGN
jgi:hypothetical protein